MKTHYFQRYHEKENVATANTMLLLSRLYSYSPDKFFRLLKSEFFADSFDPQIDFNLQEKTPNSVLDAAITQEGFKIAVETKMYDWFYTDQLFRHLSAFDNVIHKVLITLAPDPMDAKKKEVFEKKLSEYNSKQTHPVFHINTTFEALAKSMRDILDDRDYEMHDVLDDYLEYCYKDGLIPVRDSWKFMRMMLAGATFDFNIKNGVYYDKAERGFRSHDYLGLYTKKSIRAIGKVCARITAIETENGIEFEAEYGELTQERKETIRLAIQNGDSLGYNLHTIKHRYFFVEQFHETDFKKETPRPPMGARVFDLTEVLGTNTIPDTKSLADIISTKTWN